MTTHKQHVEFTFNYRYNLIQLLVECILSKGGLCIHWRRQCCFSYCFCQLIFTFYIVFFTNFDINYTLRSRTNTCIAYHITYPSIHRWDRDIVTSSCYFVSFGKLKENYIDFLWLFFVNGISNHAHRSKHKV